MATELADAAIEIDIFPWQFNFTNEYHFFWQVFNCLISSIDVYSGGLTMQNQQLILTTVHIFSPFCRKISQTFLQGRICVTIE